MLNLVIPMAGRGARFQEKGYTFPKPLVEIRRKPMIEIVVGNLLPSCDHRYIFICQREHYERYALKETLANIAPGCEVVTVEGVTEGAACTVLLAAGYFANEDELIIAISDQYVDFDVNDFIRHARRADLDGDILVFRATHPKWSYVKLESGDLVVEVAEKRPISNLATVGIYYYRRGLDFLSAAEQMITKDIRTNNEFYVCPVYNELILQGRQIGVMEIQASQMYGLGTPEDLERFLKTDICAEIPL